MFGWVTGAGGEGGWYLSVCFHPAVVEGPQSVGLLSSTCRHAGVSLREAEWWAAEQETGHSCREARTLQGVPAAIAE